MVELITPALIINRRFRQCRVRLTFWIVQISLLNMTLVARFIGIQHLDMAQWGDAGRPTL